MQPILFKIGSYPVYAYGFFIAMGVMSGFLYTYWQGKKQYGMTFDQTYALFFLLVLVGGIGGKTFVIFENPSYYLHNPQKLLSGTGFVFYGTLLLTIPTMLWYFKKIKVPIPGMLDIMAVVGCIMHVFGRTGCFLAGCCHGKPTNRIFGVTFTDPLCQAQPLNTPLHPTQLYEVAWISGMMAFLILLNSRKKFDGQIFLIYLMAYGTGRGVIEFFRGDGQRGFLFGNILSISQFISIVIIAMAAYFYFRMNKRRVLP